jgi:sialidase-1
MQRFFKNTFLFIGLILLNCQNSEPPKSSQIIQHVSVYSNPREYCAWPSIIRAKNGDLLVTFCRSEEHLGPDGEIVMVRSRDNGKTWDEGSVIYNTIIDDRESGLTILDDGTIVLHSWSTHHTKKMFLDLPPKAYGKELIDKWIQIVEQPDYKNSASLHDGWILFSEDNGNTWSQPTRGPDSNHGGIQLNDGSLLVSTYREEKGNIGIYTAGFAEENWKKLTTVICPDIDSINFGEPHILQLNSGRIIMMIRSTANPYNDLGSSNHLWETYSDDNGKTWVDMFKTPIWGYPPHLLQLSDGKILCVYGYRRPPFGQRACISDDGITWKKENEIILRDDAYNKDLGYPASVELEPGKILTVYYQPDPADGPQIMDPPDPNRSRPDILGTIWEVPERK